MLYEEVLEDAGFEVDAFDNGKDALEKIFEGRTRYQLIITDYQMPGMDGLALLKQLKRRFAYLPVLFVTAHGSVETAIEAMKNGAFDYQEKPIDLEQLVALANEACNRANVAPPILAKGAEVPYMIGRSQKMLEVYKQVGRVAAIPATVLIRGETGTGKELVANAIHQFSPRADKPMIAVNCAAIPESLLESELFGYEKGAFTGAQKTRMGHFERADGGTLFLDEIGDISLSTQVRLLRAIQERSIQRLGADEQRKIDVRIVAATHRDLEEMVRMKQFREDLYHRFSVTEIRLPPLRERRDDIPALTEHFIARFCEEYGCAPSGLEPGAMELLMKYDWPGNVRQLQNSLRKALLRANNLTISKSDVREAISQPATSPESDAPADVFNMQDWVGRQVRKAVAEGRENLRDAMVEELDTILAKEALEICDGNRSKASRILGVTRRTVRQRAGQ